MKRSAGSGSIARRLVLAGALISIVSGIGLGGASAVLDLRRSIKIATDNADRLLYSATPQLETAYWDVDLATAQAILDRLIDHPLINSLRIEDLLLSTEQLRIARIPRFEVSRPAPAASAQIFARYLSPGDLTQTRSILLKAPDGERDIARLDVTFSLAEFYSGFTKQALRIILTSILQALLLAALLFLLAKRYIISPLGDLSRAAQRLHEGDRFSLGDRTSLRKAKHDDEITRLAQQFSSTVAQMERYRDNLREEVDQRTAELVVARNDALAASRAKSTFIANMSHELRTPLNAITGLSELLLSDDRLPVTSSRLVTDMQGAARQLLGSIDSVLDLTKLEGGHMTFEQRPMDLAEVFDEVVTQTRALIGTRPLELQAEVAPDLPSALLGDRQKLAQVLLNLTSNAVKFTATGRITLRFAKRGDGLRISVFDTGIGISSRDQATIFAPFTQADSTISREASGTGLGLAIARQMVEGMGGSLHLHSRPGLGSLFVAKLPLIIGATPEGPPPLPQPAIDIPAPRLRRRLAQMLRRAHLTAPSEGQSLSIEDGRLMLGDYPLVLPVTHRELRLAAGEAQAPALPSTALRERRVLVVEDREINRVVIGEMLRRKGVRVTLMPSGPAALAALGPPLPDAIITDLHMPEMDGIELTRELRARGIVVPVIASSADVSTETYAACREAGFAGFLPKPVTGAALADALTAALEGTLPAIDRAALDRNTDGDAQLAARWLDGIGPEIREWRGLLAGEMPLPDALHAIRGAALQLGASEVCQAVAEKPVDLARIDAALDRLLAAASSGSAPQPL